MSDRSTDLAAASRALELEFFGARENPAVPSREVSDLRSDFTHVAAISQAGTIDRMTELGVGMRTWAAIFFVPLAEVAWADGKADRKESVAVLAAAEQAGATPETDAHLALAHWLTERPRPLLFTAWCDVIRELSRHLTAAEKDALCNEIVESTRAIAGISGRGFLGFGKKVCLEEERVLGRIGQQLIASPEAKRTTKII